MAYIRKIKASLVTQESDAYVGEESYLFYDIETGCIRIYDGTPGGRPICGGLDSGGTNGIAEYPTIDDFPDVGESNVIYIDASTNYTYYWDGSTYITLTEPGLEEHITNISNPHSTTLANLDDTIITSVMDNDVLQYNSVQHKWVNVEPAEIGLSLILDDLSDVNITTETDGDLLQYNGTQHKWINIEPSDVGLSLTLGDLSNVDTTTKSDGDLLQYSEAQNKWLSIDPGGLGLSLALNDLTDVDTTGKVERSIILYDADSSTWIPEASEDYKPRNSVGQLFIMPDETVHPTTVFAPTHVEVLPFYPYKTGYGAGSPGYWGYYQFLYDDVMMDYRVRGNGFSLNGDGRIECNWNGDVMITLYITLSHSANNASVGISYCRERVYEEYFPLSTTTQIPNISKPRNMSMNAIIPVWAGDRLGIGICTDIDGTITYYDGSIVCQYTYYWE